MSKNKRNRSPKKQQDKPLSIIPDFDKITVPQGSIGLFILDLDNTLTDTMDFWGEATEQMLLAIHEMRGVPMDELHEMTKNANAQYLFGNGNGLVRQLTKKPAMKPYLQDSEYVTKYQDTLAGDVWAKVQQTKAHFFPGVSDFLREAQGRNIPLVIDTDAEQSSVILRMWHLCNNAIKEDPAFAGWQPHEVLDLFSGFYTQENDHKNQDDARVLYYVDPYFVSQFKHHAQTWPKNNYKPSNAHAKRIMADFGVDTDQVMMIGDTHKDAGTVRPENGDGFTAYFGLAHYGMHIDDRTQNLQNIVGSSHFKYGPKAVFNEMSKMGIEADIILQNTIADTIPYMRPTQQKPKAP
jgi:phosphoglycolate phosphatase-like HAD superfamily hydrolase